MAKAKYSRAPEVKEIADKLISTYFSNLNHPEVRIEYLYVDKVPSKSGKDVWGTFRKITNINAYLSTPGLPEEEDIEPFPYFVMIISKPIWEMLDSNARNALVHHELCHASVEEKEDGVKLSTRSHDLEEFSDVVKLYGLWRDDVEEFLKSAKEEAIS